MVSEIFAKNAPKGAGGLRQHLFRSFYISRLLVKRAPGYSDFTLLGQNEHGDHQLTRFIINGSASAAAAVSEGSPTHVVIKASPGLTPCEARAPKIYVQTQETSY